MLSTLFDALHLSMSLCISFFFKNGFLWGEVYECAGH